MNKRTIGSIASLLLIVVSASFLWSNHYNINDWYKLRSYSAPAEVAKLADDVALNDYGRRLFYINTPQISERQTFSEQCKAEQTIVLGCYNGSHIYVFKVDDPKLTGVEQVTAAHEMLHVAYDRLGGSEKQKIDDLLLAAYNRLNDPKLQTLIASYEKTEPGQTANELHSILGTEHRNLGPELEAYYQKYFNDRSKVVAYAEQYQKVFDDINKQVQTYDAELSLRKAEIERREANLESQAARIASQKATMDALLNNGQNSAYNAQVASYNSGVNSYNAEIARVQTLIGQYNALVITRNSLTVQQQDLAKSIDSRPSAISN